MQATHQKDQTRNEQLEYGVTVEAANQLLALLESACFHNRFSCLLGRNRYSCGYAITTFLILSPNVIGPSGVVAILNGFNLEGMKVTIGSDSFGFFQSRCLSWC